jgi:hypothetical protein
VDEGKTTEGKGERKKERKNVKELESELINSLNAEVRPRSVLIHLCELLKFL